MGQVSGQLGQVVNRLFRTCILLPDGLWLNVSGWSTALHHNITATHHESGSCSVATVMSFAHSAYSGAGVLASQARKRLIILMYSYALLWS
jgi:hypothetical protein